MRHLIKNIFLFTSCFCILLACTIGCYFLFNKVSLSDLPPPHFSNSLAFNDKLLFLQNKKAEVISVGSSMTLNNLDSKTIVHRLYDKSYLNLGSWGICMKDIYLLVKGYCRFYKPKICIVSSNLIDFENKNIKINFEEISDFLSSEKSENFKYHFKNFNTSYYAGNFPKMKEYKRNRNIYEYLAYDEFGAVLLDSSNFQITQARWSDPGFTSPQPLQYVYLDSLSLFCKLQDIQLYFFQSPFREGMYHSGPDGLDSNKIKEHLTKVSSILKKRDQYFVNANQDTWNDKLFLDALHFHSIGAKLYTDYCFNHLK